MNRTRNLGLGLVGLAATMTAQILPATVAALFAFAGDTQAQTPGKGPTSS
jgi:hypothetical protein